MSENTATEPVYIISFLGTGNYVPCCYETEDWKDCKVVKYVQTAVCTYWRDVRHKNVSLLLFCTKDARKRNWENTNWDKAEDIPEARRNLRQELEENGFGEYKEGDLSDFSNTFKMLPVDDPFSREGNWSIFKVLSEAVPENAKIVFDITHSFRSLPMVMSILLNYLKVTKNIELLGCHYGAFEAVENADGTKFDPRNPETLEAKNRKAPLVSIEEMFELNDWAQAVHDFEDLGNAGHFRELSNACISGEETTDNERLRGIVRSICDFSDNVMLNRLGRPGVQLGIFTSEYTESLKIPEQWGTKPGFMNALAPLLRGMSNRLTGKLGLKTPSEDCEIVGALNGIRAAYWASKHEMIPQALTLLQESIILFYSIYYREIILTKKEKDNRDAMERILSWMGIRLGNPSETFNDPKQVVTQDIAEKICQDIEQRNRSEEKVSFAQFYNEIRQKRNNMNHAGTTGNLEEDFSLDSEFWQTLFSYTDFRNLRTIIGD